MIAAKGTSATVNPADTGQRHDYVHEDATHEQAQAALEDEKALSFRQALMLYPKAVAWSVFFSLGVIMLAFDPQLLGSLYAMPAFQKDFGQPAGDGSYLIPSHWQSALSLGNPTGQCLGALFAAHPMDALGRKPTFAVCVVLTTALIFVQFFSTTLSTLLAGELLSGLVLGAYVVIAPAYASEVCPLALRGVLTSWTNLCFVIGQLLANGVTAGTQSLGGRWAYRVPFACQWIWCALILPGVLFAPESPWWLVRKGREGDAHRSLQRLSRKGIDVSKTLAAIVETDKLERTEARYRDCFTREGGNRRRTEIGVGVYSIQVLSGIYLINFGTLFFSLAGLDTQQAFDMGIGFLAVGFVATVLSWFAMGLVGRRTIYLNGLGVMAVLQLLIGILDCVPDSSARKGIAWAQCVLMLAWNFAYDLSVGPICFVILCEVSATKVRAKTIAVATAVQAFLGIVMTVAIPYLINPDAANLRGKTGFFWGGLASLCWVWAFLRVPETSSKTYEELDELFSRGVKARAFRTVQEGDRMADH